MQTQSVVKILAAMSSNSQSTPANKFSPVTALQPMIHQWWLLIWSKASACRKHRRKFYLRWLMTDIHISPSLLIVSTDVGSELTSLIASFDRAPGKSCLLANTRSVAPANICREDKTHLTIDILTGQHCQMRTLRLHRTGFSLKPNTWLFITSS